MPEFDHYLRQVMDIRGVLGARVIDHVSGATVASADSEHGGRHVVGSDGPAEIARLALESAAFAPIAQPGHIEEMVITAANGYHLLFFVVGAFDARLVLYLRLDRGIGNLAITQRALRAIGHTLAAA